MPVSCDELALKQNQADGWILQEHKLRLAVNHWGPTGMRQTKHQITASCLSHKLSHFLIQHGCSWSYESKAEQ